jgi:hypothetical protein
MTEVLKDKEKFKKKRDLLSLANKKRDLLIKLFEGKIDTQTHDSKIEELDNAIVDILESVGIVAVAKVYLNGSN